MCRMGQYNKFCPNNDLLIFRSVFVRIAQNWEMVFVKSVRDSMFADPIVSLNLLQFKSSACLILQDTLKYWLVKFSIIFVIFIGIYLDKILRPGCNMWWEFIFRIDDSLVSFVLFVRLEWGIANQKLVAQDTNGPIIDFIIVVFLFNHFWWQIIQRSTHGLNCKLLLGSKIIVINIPLVVCLVYEQTIQNRPVLLRLVAQPKYFLVLYHDGWYC